MQLYYLIVQPAHRELEKNISILLISFGVLYKLHSHIEKLNKLSLNFGHLSLKCP